MNSKLTTLYKHYEEIMQELSTDVVAKDIDRYTKLMKEQNDLEPIIKAYKDYMNAEKMEQDSLNIIETESDEEMLAIFFQCDGTDAVRQLFVIFLLKPDLRSPEIGK